MRTHFGGPKMVTERVGKMYGALCDKGYTIRPGGRNHMLTMPMYSSCGTMRLVNRIHYNQIAATHLNGWTGQLPVNAHYTLLITIGQDALWCEAIADDAKRATATSAVGECGSGEEWEGESECM